jgi:hypothetical protein
MLNWGSAQVGSCPAQKYWTRVEMSDSYKTYTLFLYRFNYIHKKFLGTGPLILLLQFWKKVSHDC